MMIYTYFFLLVIITVSTSVHSQSLKTFGESCSGDCDERLGLICSAESHICECMLSNATIYDVTLSHCVTKAGHPCRRIVTSSSSSSTQSLCVPHASCPALNLNCECDMDYFLTRNGTCAPVAKYREACTSRKPCDKSAGMECIGGSKSKQFQCQCKYPRDQYYDSEGKKCISYPGGNCSFDLPCVKNAKCDQDIFELRRGETPFGKPYHYNATVGKKCSCLEGFQATKSRQCLPSYQSPCGGDYYDNSSNNKNNNVCNPEENLKCFNNKICLCHNPLHQIYSLQRKKCLNLVGTKCSPSTTPSDCVEGADCENEDGVCKCKTGFSPTTYSRTCLKDFGEVCHGNRTNSKDEEESQECNFFRGLSCQNGTCNCIDDFLRYSSSLQSCLSGQGSPCGEFLLEEARLEDEKKKMKAAVEVRFIMEMSNNNNYPPVENSQINFKRMTIQCDSEAGLKCQRRDGYHKCVL